MTKAELVKQMADASGITQKQAEMAANGFVEAITDCLKKGDSIIMPKFGTFSVNERQARTGRNPSTGEPIQIPAQNVAKFKPGKDLKEAMN